MGQIKVDYNADGIEGLCVITPAVHKDPRGYFLESFNDRDMKEAGFDINFVQDNLSGSRKGTLRGLHYQIRFPQTKLVQVFKGAVYDAVVDLRPGSLTYGKYHGKLLSDENHKQFLIPRGFAHGFLVLSDFAEFHYKCDDFYHPDDEAGIAWNDPVIGIEWPEITGEYPGSADPENYYLFGTEKLILSDRDKLLPEFKTFSVKNQI